MQKSWDDKGKGIGLHQKNLIQSDYGAPRGMDMYTEMYTEWLIEILNPCKPSIYNAYKEI